MGNNNYLIHLYDELLKVTVNPNLGAAIVSCTFDNIDIFRSNVNTDEPRQSSCFIMAPFCSWLPENGFVWENKRVNPVSNLIDGKPAVHGYAWQSKWQVVSQTNNELTLKHSCKNDDWPWHYSLEQKISLRDGSLFISLVFKNKSKQVAPMSMGLHPYFPLSHDTQIQVGMNNDKGLINKVFANDFDGCITEPLWNGKIHYTNKVISLNISAQANTKLFLGIYRPKNENYICLEPITQILNTEKLENSAIGFNRIKANETAYLRYSVKPTLR